MLDCDFTSNINKRFTPPLHSDLERPGEFLPLLSLAAPITWVASICRNDWSLWRETNMNKLLSRFLADESGATAIEYGLIVALIAVVIITAVTTLGTKLDTAFTTINGKLT